MLIETRKLTVGYNQTKIVDGVDISIPINKITALIGPNGCGKSTLLKSLARILAPMSGDIHFDEKDSQSFSAKDFAKILAMLPQAQPSPEGISVREAVSYGRSPHSGFWGKLSKDDWEKVDRAMASTGITELADRKVTDLSGGQCQRVWLALTLAQDGDVVLLDEPTTYLDLNHQVELMKLMQQLQQAGKTIVTVLHDINQACRYCDHLIVMKAGQVVVEGNPQDVLTSKLLKDVFDLDAAIYPDPISGTPMCIVR